MNKTASVTRRGFVQTAGTAALGIWARRLHADTNVGVTASFNKPRFAFVGLMDHPQSVHVYAINGKSWKLQQAIETEAPVSLALHPSGESLYILNEVNEYQGLPGGTVTACRLNARTGQLASFTRHALSLSATMPRHIAVAPDGKNLIVAVHGGGAYNVLPILPGGQIGSVCSILKETGCGPVAGHQDTAHPQTVLFDPTGEHVITADLGSDRVSVLSLEDNVEVQSRHTMPSGSGPRYLALHPSGHLLYVSHALDNALSGFAYDARSGKIGKLLTQVQGEFGGPLAMHPLGDFLYAAGKDKITSWRIDTNTGSLHLSQQLKVGSRAVKGDIPAMMFDPNGNSLVTLTSSGIFTMEIDLQSGGLSNPLRCASLSDARCIAIL